MTRIPRMAATAFSMTLAAAALTATGGLGLGPQPALAGAHMKKDIVDTAVAAGSFKTLVAAVQAAGLVETLKGEGPFTVFAPTDDAFAKLPAGTLDELLKPENKDKLTAILTYHVVPGKVMSSDLRNGMKARTVQGQEATITLSEPPMVDGARIVKPDIETSNGVIHVIDAIILPAE
ncbi:putative surface protein with fasciclin (FAS1) repeats [Oceanicella actignis]|nr:putative surface protein with fasciclin (FAS1) repeats [Oceanicella actignis]